MTASSSLNSLRFVVTACAAALLAFTAASSHAQPTAQPAPIPSEVAIPRPSAAEVEQAHQSLKRFLETADPAARAIVAKYPDLITVQPPRSNTAIIPALAQGFRTKHNPNVERAKQGDIDVLFMSDGLHPTTKGYEIWAEAVKEPLANLLKLAAN